MRPGKGVKRKHQSPATPAGKIAGTRCVYLCYELVCWTCVECTLCLATLLVQVCWEFSEEHSKWFPRYTHKWPWLSRYLQVGVNSNVSQFLKERSVGTESN